MAIDVCMVVYNTHQLTQFHYEYWRDAGVDVRILLGDTHHGEADRTPEYPNVEISHIFPTEEYDGFQHGYGLDNLKQRTSSEFIIVQDHDFFWLHPNIWELFQSLKVPVFGASDMGCPMLFDYHDGDMVWPGELFDINVPICTAKIIRRDLAMSQSFVLTKEEAIKYGYEVGWRVRHEIMKTDVPSLGLHSFKYPDQPDPLMTFWGHPERPYGVHYNAASKRQPDAAFIRSVLDKYRAIWHPVKSPVSTD